MSQSPEKALKIVQLLNQEFPETPTPLEHQNAFELLLAVILSAQCTDERINTITPKLFKAAIEATDSSSITQAPSSITQPSSPSSSQNDLMSHSSASRPCLPIDILNLGESKVRDIIKPSGYYNSKTKALMGTSQALALKGTEYEAQFGNIVPSGFEELTALPGVGGKTAQVIQSQWFKMDAFPVDTHIHRVCNRLGLADSGKNRDKTEQQMKALIHKKYWSKLHLQIIFHGRKTCTAYKPKCGTCPLRQECQWKQKENYS
jgi:endonuclease-3